MQQDVNNTDDAARTVRGRRRQATLRQAQRLRLPGLTGGMAASSGGSASAG
jgi:hypothetical protein